jgi:uncharacterized RDD family membrane protein YckC
MIIFLLVGGLISRLGGNEDWWTVTAGIISLTIPVVYFVWPYSTRGQTLGKKMLRIKVVSLDGSPLNWRKGILRSAGYIVSFSTLLGFLWSIWDADKQAWHDKLAGTRVVWAWVGREQLQGTIDLSEARRSQKRWLLGLGIPSLLILSTRLLQQNFLF